MSAIIEQIFVMLVGMLSLAFFVGVAAYIIFQSNSRWREYEALYAKSTLTKPKARKLTGMVRISQPGFRWGHLSGDVKSHRHPPVMVGVHDNGLSMSIMPPFKYGCRDLFLPFDKMTIKPAKWDFLSNSYGIQMDGVEGIEIVVFSNILHWAGEHSEMADLMIKRADLMSGEQAA